MPDFADVYEEHVWSVYGFFAYRTGATTDAEDLTQLTFERALRAWPRYDERRAQPATWLMAIARNVLIDNYRRDRADRREPLREDAGSDARLPTVAGPEERLGPDPELTAALAELGEREREVLALRFGSDLNGPEIAELLELTLANVHQILSRTLRRLRTELEGGEPSRAQVVKGPAPTRPAPATRRRASPDPP